MYIKKTFKNDSTINTLVSYNILTYYTFDIQNSTILPSFMTNLKEE